jgi:hypothetical protein
MNGQLPNFSSVYNSRCACPVQPSATAPAVSVPGQPDIPGTAVYRQQSAVAAAPQGAVSETDSAPITDTTRPMPLTLESMQYLNGFLRAQVGRRIRAEFLIGTNTYLEKSGKLLGVGANYILLQEAMSDNLLVCDFYNIKFITIFQ